MDELRAKFLLQSGRPRGKDGEDASFQEASAAAGSNPELAAWVREQEAISSALHDKLNEINPPAGLRDRILAGGAVSSAVAVPTRRWWLKVAAGIAVALGVWMLLLLSGVFGGGPGLPQFRRDMCAFLSGPFQLELHSRTVGELTEHLANEHDFAGYRIPDFLAQSRGYGCRVLRWQDHEVALICFSLGPNLVHLMVLPRTEALGALVIDGIERKQIDQWATAAWSEGDHVYLLSTRGPPQLLNSNL
jgi:hypothetical protein